MSLICLIVNPSWPASAYQPPTLRCNISERTPRKERDIANHPSLKPQSFLRQIVRAALPLGQGIIIDPFMGSGSTVAAAEAQGLTCIGVERYSDYFGMAKQAVPKLVNLLIEHDPLQFSLISIDTRCWIPLELS